MPISIILLADASKSVFGAVWELVSVFAKARSKLKTPFPSQLVHSPLSVSEIRLLLSSVEKYGLAITHLNFLFAARKTCFRCFRTVLFKVKDLLKLTTDSKKRKQNAVEITSS